MSYDAIIEANRRANEDLYIPNHLLVKKPSILKEPLLWNDPPQKIEAFENVLVDEFLPRAQKAMVEGRAFGYCVHGLQEEEKPSHHGNVFGMGGEGYELLRNAAQRAIEMVHEEFETSYAKWRVRAEIQLDHRNQWGYITFFREQR